MNPINKEAAMRNEKDSPEKDIETIAGIKEDLGKLKPRLEAMVPETKKTVKGIQHLEVRLDEWVV